MNVSVLFHTLLCKDFILQDLTYDTYIYNIVLFYAF